MVHIDSPITADWIAANERAYQNRQAGRVVTMVRPGLYTAPSSKGDGSTYTTTVTNPGRLQGTCTCPHGQHGKAGHCWHLAAAIAAEVRRVSPKREQPAASAEAARKAEVERLMARFAKA